MLINKLMVITQNHVKLSARLTGTTNVSDEYADTTSQLINELIIRNEKKVYLIFGGRVHSEFETLHDAQTALRDIPVLMTIIDLTGDWKEKCMSGHVIRPTTNF